MTRYTVTTFDVACGGAERLRNQDEFILLAYPSRRTAWRDLRDQWLADIQFSDREDNFDYGAARRCVERYCTKIRRSLKGKTLERLIGGFAVHSDDQEGVMAFLYVRDNKESKT